MLRPCVFSITVGSDTKRMYITILPTTVSITQSPREIKRREVSWTFTKKPRRDQEQGGGAGLECWASFASVVFERQSYRYCPCDCSA